MVPATWKTRCLRQGEIHEFIICTPGLTPEPLDELAYLGFAEITDGGVVAVGDSVRLGDEVVGRIHGFDEAHVPNHYNILVAGEQLRTGENLKLGLDGTITIGS